LRLKSLCFILLLLLQLLSSTVDSGGACARAVTLPEPEPLPYPAWFLTGRFDPATHPDFSPIENYNVYAGMYLQKEAKAALDSLVSAAGKEGIYLNVISATRNFEKQKSIWENKIKRYSANKFHLLSPSAQKEILNRILIYSAMPAASRHHWGTDVDFCSVELAFWNSRQGRNISRWLHDNAGRFGFGMVYTKNRTGGHAYEPWHWSYLPLSGKILQYYLSTIAYHDISGFSGAEFAAELELFPRFMQNVFDGKMP
jgi:hypothetical protein